jgi:hypothetical protein
VNTLPEQNPYELLQVPRDASLDEIEDAYDALYDLHEPAARGGDEREIAFLTDLNEAREVLLDPQRRAHLDQKLHERPRRPAKYAGPRTPPSMRAQETVPRRAAAPSPGAATYTGAVPAKVRRRSGPRPRYVAPPTRNMRVPVLVAGALMVVLVFALAIFLLMRGPQGGLSVPLDPARGEVIATVNGVPVYADDWQERIERDKNSALSDPLFSPFVNNFQGVTGTRMLDILSYDAMDKLINMEVIMQQAKKEGLYPTPAQEKGLIDEAKTTDLQGGVSFEAFLRDKNLSEAKYNRTVIQNVVYTVMADRHVPKTGTSQARTDGFIKWICETRKSYDVRILRKFLLESNVPCTSGLPSDLPLPGVEQEEIPEDLPTAVLPANPNPNATPAP